MTLRNSRVRNALRRTVCGAAAAVFALSLATVGDVHADPADDAVSDLNELSRQAVQSANAVGTAQNDLEAKLAAQAAAEERHQADLVALEAANAQLQTYQAAVDRVAAMTYVSGRARGLPAILTAESPQQLIDDAWAQRAIAAEMANQMKAFQDARERAAIAAQASAASAADARIAAEQAAAVRADLQSKRGVRQRQVAAAQRQYDALTPEQRAVFDAQPLPPPPPAAPGAPPPPNPALVAMPGQPPLDLAASRAGARPELPAVLPVGVAPEAGLRPLTIEVARAISARFPEIVDIGGVRPDSKPWHPNGLAIDVMIPNPGTPEGDALGDEIRDFVLANAGRFGIQDAIWQDVYYTPSGPSGSGYGHWDHVHVTTTGG